MQVENRNGSEIMTFSEEQPHSQGKSVDYMEIAELNSLIKQNQ